MRIRKTVLCLILLLFVALRITFFFYEDMTLFGKEKKLLAEVFILYVCALTLRFLQYRFKTVIPAVAITIAASACDILLCNGIAVLYLIPILMFVLAQNVSAYPEKKKKGVDITVMLWVLALILIFGYLVFEIYRLNHGIIDLAYPYRFDKHNYVYYVLLVFIYGFIAVYGKQLSIKQKTVSTTCKRQRLLYVLCAVSFVVLAFVPSAKGYMCFVFPMFDFWCVNLVFLYLEGETILVSLVGRFEKKLHRFLLS